jgi:pentatricopeptide repeat protein
LAIHPDYLLRSTITREMKERWLEISPEGHQHIAIGLLREEQYELALEKLDEMRESGMQVEGWVFDIFIYVFGKMEFLDDALRIVRHRLDCGHDVPVNVWYFLLEVCSKGQNMSATRYIWNRAVQQGIVNPSDGVALDILNMAAVYGDTDLSTQVIENLASRGTRLSRYHYEALIDAYAAQKNVGKALEVYCIMQVAGVEVTNSSTGSLAFALSRDPYLIDEAIQALSQLREKHSVPITVFNCLLNEIVKANVEQPDDAFAKALSLYRQIREFVPTGPNLETFRNMLWKCTRPELVQFFAGEMIHFNIKPNLAVTKQMYRINVEYQGPSHRAKDYFFKVAPHFSAGQGLSKGQRKAEVMDLSVKLIKRLIVERDPAAWRILEICKANGLEEETIHALRAEVEAGTITGASASSYHGPIKQDTVSVKTDAAKLPVWF